MQSVESSSTNETATPTMLETSSAETRLHLPVEPASELAAAETPAVAAAEASALADAVGATLAPADAASLAGGLAPAPPEQAATTSRDATIHPIDLVRTLISGPPRGALVASPTLPSDAGDVHPGTVRRLTESACGPTVGSRSQAPESRFVARSARSDRIPPWLERPSLRPRRASS